MCTCLDWNRESGKSSRSRPPDTRILAAKEGCVSSPFDIPEPRKGPTLHAKRTSQKVNFVLRRWSIQQHAWLRFRRWRAHKNGRRRHGLGGGFWRRIRVRRGQCRPTRLGWTFARAWSIPQGRGRNMESDKGHRSWSMYLFWEFNLHVRNIQGYSHLPFRQYPPSFLQQSDCFSQESYLIMSRWAYNSSTPSLRY